jgi:predicted ATP-grasp superfamily ATP-dependent carboligase
MDKLRLIEVAANAGLGAPATVVCHGVEDAALAARKLGFPAVVKPRRSIIDDGPVRSQLSTRLVFDEAQLRELAPEYGRPFLIQAREPGAVYSCSGVMLSGGLVSLLTTRYLRTWPPEGGEVAFSVTVETPPGLSRAVENVLSALGWQGLFELELIRRADGSFAAIDLNPRLYGSLAAAVAAGAPLPAIWCDWLRTGNAKPPMTRTGLMYRWEEGDLRYFFWELRRGQVGRARTVLRPHRGLLHAYFRPSDPGPLVARAVQVVRIAGQRHITKSSPRGGDGSRMVTQS